MSGPKKSKPTRSPAKTSAKAAGSSREAKPKPGLKKDSARETVQNWLQLAQLRSEKCELKEARVAYGLALQQAKRVGDLKATMEALSGLLRLAAEALDEEAVREWDQELDALMAAHPRQIPAMAWHCKGAVATYHKQPRLAQRYFHRFLRAVGGARGSEEQVAKGWVMLAITLSQRGRVARAKWLAEEILRRFEARNFRSINGIVYLLLGTLAERAREYDVAMGWFQKAHSSFLGEHNWNYHLYVLYGYARLARVTQNYSQAYWYLDLVDKATAHAEFAMLRQHLAVERSRLEQDAVDLIVDSRHGVVKTRDGQSVSLRKQYVLLHILEALSSAHRKAGEDNERGLSKAEIIERVWKEQYRPEAHDNKLYYNINRLRKLIEPDVRKPQYLLNWKEGYRLAPGLRIQFIGGAKAAENAGGN
jgi:DNA-binding winged helix-turn-helix (wHTH) protein